MKKSAIFLFLAATVSLTSMAQNVQEGINHLYAQRYASAKGVFDKLIAANPNNMEAVYWLGQTNLASNDVASAKALYSKTLATNGNAPLILAGMGNVELLENKPAEARQHFEQAIAAAKVKKGTDPNVLNAVGRANTNVYTNSKKQGDLDYAIAKLSEAAAAAPTNTEIAINLGNAYRKKNDGTNAVVSYHKAGNFAPALYREAMLYKAQNNWEIVKEKLADAIKADPKFAPAYFEQYEYNLYYTHDYAAAETAANIFVANADPSVENDYLKAQTAYVQKKYSDAITFAKNIVSQTNNNPNPRVFRLLGYSYLGAKDSATACTYVTQFFSKAAEEDILGQDYLLKAKSCDKGNPDLIAADITTAVKMDSVPATQVKLLNDAIAEAKANGQRILEATLREVSYNLRSPNASPVELISYIAVPYYFGGAYQKADSIARLYSTLAPDSIYGYRWSALALSALDSSNTLGLAGPQFEKVLTVTDKDKARFKSEGVQATKYLVFYYANIKQNKDSALFYAQKGLTDYDTENAELKEFMKQLQGPAHPASPANKPSATQPANKPKTTGGR